MGTFMVIGVALDWYSMAGLTIMIFLFVLGQGLTGPNSAALALAPFSKHAGSAASLLGSFRMLMGGVITVWVSAWHDGSALPMVIAMWTVVVASVVLFAVVKVTVRYRARKRVVEDEPAVLL
jgi:DHA1 family bicyclomycin/chloramphenicol resistance-like MFS transporter